MSARITHFVDFGTLTIGSGSESLSGSAEMAWRLGRNLIADSWWRWPRLPLQQLPPPPPPYRSRSSDDICMDMMWWVRGRTTCRNLSISLRRCRTLASRSSNRCSRRAMYSSFFRDSDVRRASSRSRSRNLFITDVLIATGWSDARASRGGDGCRGAPNGRVTGAEISRGRTRRLELGRRWTGCGGLRCETRAGRRRLCGLLLCTVARFVCRAHRRQPGQGCGRCKTMINFNSERARARRRCGHRPRKVLRS